MKRFRVNNGTDNRRIIYRDAPMMSRDVNELPRRAE